MPTETYEPSSNRDESDSRVNTGSHEGHADEPDWVRGSHPEWDASLTEDDRREREETYREAVGLVRLALEKWTEQGLTAEEARQMANLELDRISNHTPRE